MPSLSPRRIHRLTHRAIATVVAVSLLSMPVTYRGGAEAAHAHTVFQLWEDVRSGSFTHHPVAAGDAGAVSNPVAAIRPDATHPNTSYPDATSPTRLMSSSDGASPSSPGDDVARQTAAAPDGHTAKEHAGTSGQEPAVVVSASDPVTDHVEATPPVEVDTVATGLVADHAVATERADVAAREPARGSPVGTEATIELGEAAPVASSAFTPNVRGTALVLPISAALPIAESFSPVAPESRRMDGIVDAPIAPPPRRTA